MLYLCHQVAEQSNMAILCCELSLLRTQEPRDLDNFSKVKLGCLHYLDCAHVLLKSGVQQTETACHLPPSNPALQSLLGAPSI